jgi:hypothetical protein
MLAAVLAVAEGCAGHGTRASATTTSGGGGSAGSTVLASSAGGSGGSGGAHGDIGPFVGLPCEDDSPCGPGGSCYRATDQSVAFLGGFVHGYCTGSCFHDVDCGSGNFCMANGEVGFCVQGCTYGSPPLSSLNGPLSKKKCHGREDTACVRRTGLLPDGCFPVCGRDEECPVGRKCDLYSGSCTELPKMGLPFGARCDGSDPGNEPCAGLCVTSLGPSQGFCSARCVFGSPDLTDECGGIDKGLCALDFGQNVKAGMGDMAGCSAACSTHADCATPLTYCATFGPVAGHAYCGIPPPCAVSSDCPLPTMTCVSLPQGMTCIDLSHGDPTSDGGP